MVASRAATASLPEPAWVMRTSAAAGAGAAQRTAAASSAPAYADRLRTSHLAITVLVPTASTCSHGGATPPCTAPCDFCAGEDSAENPWRQMRSRPEAHDDTCLATSDLPWADANVTGDDGRTAMPS